MRTCLAPSRYQLPIAWVSKRNQSSLYPGHIQLTPLQKLKLTCTSAFTAFQDPTRQDMVAALGETTGHLQLQNLYQKMLSTEEGRQILKIKPKVNSSTVHLEKLAKLEKNTFGYHYYMFLKRNQVSPDTRSQVHYIDDLELAYVMQRYREIHDFIHTLLGLNISVEEELHIKYFELMQTQLPLTFLSATVGTFTSDLKVWFSKANLKGLQQVVGNGIQAEFLLNVYFEKYFEWDLHRLRRKLKVWV